MPVSGKARRGRTRPAGAHDSVVVCAELGSIPVEEGGAGQQARGKDAQGTQKRRSSNARRFSREAGYGASITDRQVASCLGTTGPGLAGRPDMVGHDRSFPGATFALHRVSGTENQGWLPVFRTAIIAEDFLQPRNDKNDGCDSHCGIALVACPITRTNRRGGPGSTRDQHLRDPDRGRSCRPPGPGGARLGSVSEDFCRLQMTSSGDRQAGRPERPRPPCIA